jgi:hypothetical protein
VYWEDMSVVMCLLLRIEKIDLTYGYWSVPIGADNAIDFTLCAQLFWRESPGHDGEDVVVAVVVGGSGRHGERASRGRQTKRER